MERCFLSFGLVLVGTHTLNKSFGRVFSSSPQSDYRVVGEVNFERNALSYVEQKERYFYLYTVHQRIREDQVGGRGVVEEYSICTHVLEYGGWKEGSDVSITIYLPGISSSSPLSRSSLITLLSPSLEVESTAASVNQSRKRSLSLCLPLAPNNPPPPPPSFSFSLSLSLSLSFYFLVSSSFCPCFCLRKNLTIRSSPCHTLAIHFLSVQPFE